MKVPLSWIKDFISISASPLEIADTLTLLGIEVEKITGLSPAFSNVVVGKVIAAHQHPNADRLRVAKVTDGTAEFQVVCGAPNCREGIVVAFARIGAELTDEEGKKWKIKKSKLRDVESEGMLCSAKELQLSDEHEGIIELPSETPLGIDVASLVSDPVFDISLTPNLGHCLSVLGIARELAAAYKTDIKKAATSCKESGLRTLLVEVENRQLAPRYACRIMTNIEVGPSPEWLQRRLTQAGQRPINNLVDIANYVMLEMGQPLHIFDLDTIDEKIVVTTTKEPIRFQTLDEQERSIPPNTILISDAKKPLAIAGIMGGFSSAATPKTRNILIESAVFDPTSIRKSSRLLDLKTDASYRFDRGIDREAVLHALNRAAALIQEIAGGEIHPAIDIQAEGFAPKKIECRLPRLHQMLGFSLSKNEIISLFERLEMKVHSEGDVLLVTPPSYRNDVTQEIDLVEEVARIYGYNHIPRDKPVYKSSDLIDAPLFSLEKEVRALLLEQGLQECVTCDLISPELAHLTLEKGISENSTIHVLHPRSIDQSVLRTSLLPGLLQVVRHNFNHQVETIPIFEVGRIHFRLQDQIEEASCAGILITGKNRPHHFDRKPADVDFFDLKGIVENLCEGLRIAKYSFEPSHLHTLHPWRQARIKSGDITIGVIGEVHPQLLSKFDLQERLFFAELHLPDLLHVKKKPRIYSELAAFPSSVRDWTVMIGETISMDELFKSIDRTKSPYLDHYYLLDLYTSDQLGQGQKNVTLRFVYRDRTKTISLETVEQEHQKLIQAVAEKLPNCV